MTKHSKALEMHLLAILQMEIPQHLAVEAVTAKLSSIFENPEEFTSETVRQHLMSMAWEGLIATDDAPSIPVEKSLEENSAIFITQKGLDVLRVERREEVRNNILRGWENDRERFKLSIR